MPQLAISRHVGASDLVEYQEATEDLADTRLEHPQRVLPHLQTHISLGHSIRDPDHSPTLLPLSHDTNDGHIRPELVSPLTNPRAYRPPEAAHRRGNHHRDGEEERLSGRLTNAMMSARAHEQLNPGRHTPYRTADSRSSSEHRHRQLHTALLTSLENMEALERVVESVPDPEEQSGRGQSRAPLHSSGSDHRSPASSSKRSASQQLVQPQQNEVLQRHETPIQQPVTDSVTLTYQCLDALQQTNMSQYINGTAAKCLRTTIANSPGIAALPRIEAKAVGKEVGENEISLEIILKVSGDENIVTHISNCVETLRAIAEALIPGEDDDNSKRTLIHHSADFLLSALDTLFTAIIAKPKPNQSIESCSISQLSPRAMVVAEGLYPDFIPMWGIVPSTLEEALISSQALLSTTGKVYMFGDLSHLMHQRRNVWKMTTETLLLTDGPHVTELMTFGFSKEDAPSPDSAAKRASTSDGSDRGDGNVDLESHKRSESGDSEQPSPIMTVNIDMLRFRPGYANIEDRRKIRASKLLEDTANEVAHLFQSLNEHVPTSYYDDRITTITQHNGIITASGGLSTVYFLHDVIRWMNTDDGGECLGTATYNILPGETKGGTLGTEAMQRNHGYFNVRSPGPCISSTPRGIPRGPQVTYFLQKDTQ